MKDEEFGNNFYDESSEKILGTKKFPKKKLIIIASSVAMIVVLLIILIIISVSINNKKNQKSKKGEIRCEYYIPFTDKKIQILGKNYIKENNFEIFIDEELILYNKEYQFSSSGMDYIDYILYDNNISMEKMFEEIDYLISIELYTEEQNIYINSISQAFDGCKNLISFNLKGFNTKKIKSFHKLFHTQLKFINMTKFEVKELEDMSYIFSGTRLKR